ncbi:hypothetical protein Hanom_Chr15g01414491 [Helianthus anomalus]
MKSSVEVNSDVDIGVGDEKKKDADQTQITTANTDVPITKVNSDSEILKIVEQCKKCMETCSDCTIKDEKFRTRDLEFTKIEEVFKIKCREMLENEKV